MSAPTVTAIRADVVGSLLRPDYLKEATAKFDAGELSAEQLSAVQDRAAIDALRLQEECSVQVVTDGEVRRRAWFDPLTESLGGYTRDAVAPVPFTNERGTVREMMPLPAATRPLALTNNLPLREYEFARGHTSLPVKVTLPSMTYASVLWVPGSSDAVYPDRAAYMQETLGLVKQMVGACVAAGARYVQLDAPRYTHLVSQVGIENFKRLQIDVDHWLEDMIALDNQLVDAFPEVTFGLHLCRGNNRSMWSVEGGYDAIAEQLFNGIHVQRLLLEYDTPRAGDFAPLRYVPREKTVVLGLISTKTAELERDDEIRRRIDEAAQHVPLDRLALSPQCGFASTFEGNLVTPEIQKAKLQLVARVARAVWG